MPQPPPLLRVTDLRIEFPVERLGVVRRVAVVDGASVEIGRGEAVGLVGESGCGKSVTALAVLGLLPPQARVAAGRIEFDGRDVTAASARERQALRGAHIGYIGQDPGTALNPVFTIGDQIADALVAHRRLGRRAARREAVALLEAVRIPRAADRALDYPHQLSGGQRQRALLAAALACSPALLIADEPTTALDVTVQAEILALLRSLREERQLSLLLITHDLGVVATLTNRVAVMYAGRLVEVGPTPDVLARPRHPYTQGLLASIPGGPAGARLSAIPGTVPDLAALPAGCAFAPRCGDREPRCDRERPPLTQSEHGRHVRCLVDGGPS